MKTTEKAKKTEPEITPRRPHTRPWEEQSYLERHLQSALSGLYNKREQAEKYLPTAIRKKDWGAAAQCERDILNTRFPIKDFEGYLDLYDKELNGDKFPGDPPEEEDEDVERSLE